MSACYGFQGAGCSHDLVYFIFFLLWLLHVSPFFLQMTALRSVKAPEEQEKNLAANGQGRTALKVLLSELSFSRGKKKIIINNNNNKKIPCRLAGGSQAVYAEEDGEEGFRGMGRTSMASNHLTRQPSLENTCSKHESKHRSRKRDKDQGVKKHNQRNRERGKK